MKTFILIFKFVVLGLTANAKTLIDCNTYVPLPTNASMQDATNQVNGNVDCLRINLADGSKNRDGIKRIAEIIALGKSFAGGPIPPSSASTAEIALVGQANSAMKFQSLLMALSISLQELSATYESLGDKSCGIRCKEIFAQVEALTELGHQTFFLGYSSDDPVSPQQARSKADEYIKILANGLASQVDEGNVKVRWEGPHRSIVEYPNHQGCVLTVQIIDGIVNGKSADRDFVCP